MRLGHPFTLMKAEYTGIGGGDPRTWPVTASGKLRRGTTYYWGMVARDDDGVNHTYGPWSFTTEGQQRVGVLDVERNPQSAASVGLSKRRAVSSTPRR